MFAWIAEHQKTFYSPRAPVKAIGVYFSPATRNYSPKEFLHSYQGILILLMRKHLAYAIVTPRTLAAFNGSTLIFPDVSVVDESERNLLTAFAKSGKTVVITGTDATGLASQKSVVRFADCPGKAYLQPLEKNFAETPPSSAVDFLKTLPANPEVRVEASPMVATCPPAINIWASP